MNCSLYQILGQVSSDEVGQIFRDHIRGCVREMISEVMATEVNELCGPKHHPTESDHFRAGSSTGRVLFECEPEDVIRPRVQKRNADDSSEEVALLPKKSSSTETVDSFCPVRLPNPFPDRETFRVANICLGSK